MQEKKNQSGNDNFLRLSSYLAVLVAALGILGIFAWFYNSTVLVSLDPDWVPMAPSTAAFFVFLGFALLTMNQHFGRKFDTALILSTLPVLFSASFLVYSSMNSIFYPIERLGFPIANNLNGIPLGHISPVTAMGIALAAFSTIVVLFKRRIDKSLHLLAITPILLLLATGWLLTTAYVLGGPLLYGTPFIPPASTTSAGLLLLGISLLAASLSDFDFSFNPSRSTRILLVILAFLTAGTTATGYLYFRTFHEKLAKTVEANVRSLIREKIRHFSAWLAEKNAYAEIFHNNENFDLLLNRYFADPENAQIRNRFEHWLFKLGKNPDFSAVFLVRLSDSSFHGDAIGKKYFDFGALRSLIAKVSDDNRIHMSDLLRNPKDGSFFSVITVPVMLEPNSNSPQAIVCMIINPDTYLFPMLGSWPAEEKTVQTLLLSSENESYQIFEVRQSEKDLCFTNSDHENLIKNIKFSPADSFFSFQFLSSNGKQMTAFVKAVPSTRWRVLTMIETRELNSQAIERLGIVVIIIALLLLVSVLGIMSLWFQQNRALFKKQHEAAQALIESEKNLRSIFDNMLDGILVADTDSRSFYLANSAICRMLGYEKAELLKMSVNDIHPIEKLDEAIESFQKSLSGEPEQAPRIHVKRKDGSTFYAEIAASLINFGNKTCLMGVFRDVTQQDLAERKILHLNSALSGIRHVNQLITRETDPVKLVDLACEKLFDARGFDSVLLASLTPDKQIAHLNGCGPVAEKFKTVDRIEDLPDLVKQCLAEKRMIVENDGDHNFTFVLPFLYSESIYGFMAVYIRNTVINLDDEKGLLQEAADDLAFALHAMNLKKGLQESVEALQKTEEQLRQSQKLDAIGQLAGGIAHDFNNILMVQMGYCELWLENADNPELAGDLQLIYDCSRKAAGLTRQLLAFSRKQTLQFEVTDLNELLQNMISMLKRLIGENIKIETSLMENLYPILVDPGQMEQILINLVVNARDAMKDGGKIVISTSNVRIDDKEFVKLAIFDTGEGIPQEIKEKIFDPFFTTKSKDKGTGLGLSTVYGIVKQSNGWIELDSEIGQGSCFNIFLPKSEGFEAKKTADKKRGNPGGIDRNILLVEDEKDLRLLLKRILVKMGFKVLAASDGKDALKNIKKMSPPPDLVITDMVMPEMSGPELLKEIREIIPDTRFLCMSGYTEDFESLLGGQIDDPEIAFIQKPFSRQMLQEKINHIFRL